MVNHSVGSAGKSCLSTLVWEDKKRKHWDCIQRKSCMEVRLYPMPDRGWFLPCVSKLLSSFPGILQSLLEGMMENGLLGKVRQWAR